MSRHLQVEVGENPKNIEKTVFAIASECVQRLIGTFRLCCYCYAKKFTEQTRAFASNRLISRHTYLKPQSPKNLELA